MVKAGNVAGIAGLMILSWGIGYTFGLKNGRELERKSPVLSYTDSVGSRHGREYGIQQSSVPAHPLPKKLQQYDLDGNSRLEGRELEALAVRLPQIKGEPQFRDFAPAVELFDLDRNHRLEGEEIGAYRTKVAENSKIFLGTDASSNFASDIYWSVEMYGWGNLNDLNTDTLEALLKARKYEQLLLEKTPSDSKGK